MKSTRSANRSMPRSGATQPSVQPSPSLNTAPPRPTYGEVIDMLIAADVAVYYQYEHIPYVRDELRTQFADTIEYCKMRDRDPVTLLVSRLKQEQRILNQYNKHRAHTKADEIAEDLESFPLRLEVVERGFTELTEDIPPVYQAADHYVHAAADADFAPAIPQTKKAKSKAPAPSKKNKTGRKVINYDKLGDAPRPNLDFPDCNILITEMAAFLPNAIKSWDVLDRVCGNGLKQYIYTLMINNYREMARGKITANSTYRMFKGPITKRAQAEPLHQPSWEDWTPTIHDQYVDAANFEPSSVSATGFRTAADGKNKISHAPIPMKSLAVGVKVFPSGEDALDLTRMIQYCVDHPAEDWFYPTDYTRLLNKIGGPAPINAANTDAAVIARWTAQQVAAGSMRKTAGRKRDSRGRLMKPNSDSEEEDYDNMDETDSEPDFDEMDETESEFDSHNHKKGNKRKRALSFDDSDDVDDDTPSQKPSAKRPKLVLKFRIPHSTLDGKHTASGPSRPRKQFVFMSDIDSDSDGDGYKAPKGPTRKKKEKKAAPAVRRSGRANKFSKSFSINEDIYGELEDDVPVPKPEVPDIIARYGMNATKEADGLTDELTDGDAEGDSLMSDEE